MRTFIYALAQVDLLQPPLSLQAGVHFCCVQCSQLLCFFGLCPLANAPTVNVDSNASIIIFFMIKLFG
ncbi:MAG TPA: hypothetical protein VHD35_14645 [Chitinophagaceae bacterium]|nr:hypothetical protein [Chitinophagaceae bacterium]